MTDLGQASGIASPVRERREPTTGRNDDSFFFILPPLGVKSFDVGMSISSTNPQIIQSIPDLVFFLLGRIELPTCRPETIVDDSRI